MIAHYLAVAVALAQVIAPWLALFAVAMVIACAPDLQARYRIWRRRRIPTARGMR